MHMRIRYHFLADLHVTRHERETESEKRIRNTQTNLVELNNLQAQIVIIDLKLHQNTHFLYTIITSMDLSMKSQTSTNTSELDHQ